MSDRDMLENGWLRNEPDAPWNADTWNICDYDGDDKIDAARDAALGEERE